MMPTEDIPEETMWPEAAGIDSPSQLTTWLKRLQDAVRSGALKEVALNSSVAPQRSVLDIDAHGPWPDYVELHFSSRSGVRYMLTVETYHGMGGTWERIMLDP